MREERFRNTRVLHEEHPGAAPLWPLTAGAGWWLLTVGSVVAVLFGILALAVALLT